MSRGLALALLLAASLFALAADDQPVQAPYIEVGDCWSYRGENIQNREPIENYEMCGTFIDAQKDVIAAVATVKSAGREIEIVLRADSGFARDALMAWCEASGVEYVFGLAKNSRLETEIAAELIEAKRLCEESAKPARRFKDFTYQTLDSWSAARRVIGKAEHLPAGAIADQSLAALADLKLSVTRAEAGFFRVPRGTVSSQL